MTQKPDGGPAYPQMNKEWVPTASGGGHVMTEAMGGVTLRDYFASQATEDDILEYMGEKVLENTNGTIESILVRYEYTRVQAKYRYADAMIAERNKP